MIAVSPTEDDTFVALRSFLVSILPEIVSEDIIQGQVNRVPEPKNADFIVMWPLLRGRLSTNIDGQFDTLYTASIAGTLMTVSALTFGILAIGSPVFGVNVASNTSIVAPAGTGTGGVGTYTVSPSQNVSSETMASGVVDVMQPTEVTIQLDVHGPLSADNAQIISTLFRDSFATDAFLSLNPNITPLFTSDPRQVPFMNSEQQVEDRWVVEVNLEVNQTVIVPQQYAGTVTVPTINVEATYPN